MAVPSYKTSRFVLCTATTLQLQIQPRKMLLDWGNWGDIDLWETLHLLVREFILSTSKASQETEDGKLFKNDFKSRKEMCKNLKKEVFLSPPVMYWIADHRLHEREIMMRAHQREDLKDKHRNTSEKRGEGFLDICKYNTNITHMYVCVSIVCPLSVCAWRNCNMVSRTQAFSVCTSIDINTSLLNLFVCVWRLKL